MSIQDDLNTRMKEAMKARDARTLALIRMIKTRVKERETSSGFEGAVDDKLVLEVIATYLKQMKKAVAEFERAGVTEGERVEQLRFEVEYLTPFLPQRLDEAATRALVTTKLSELGLEGPGQVGRLMGAIMKDHRDQVDPGLVRKVAEEVLS
jgi:uncharacterized protein YqeY